MIEVSRCPVRGALATAGTYLAHAGMLSLKKLALDEGLVTTLFRCSNREAPRYSDPRDPGIVAGKFIARSSLSLTTRIVEPVKSRR